MELTRSSQVRITGITNEGKVAALLGLLARVSGPITDQTQKFLNDFRAGAKVAPMPKAADNTCLTQFSGLIKQICGVHASGQARALINKIKKAKTAKKPAKYQTELLEKWESGTLDIKEEIKVNLNLDSRIAAIEDSNNSFDFWIRLQFPKTEGIPLLHIPIKKTRHMNDLESRGFVMKRDTVRVNRDGSLTFIYRKISEEKRARRLIGIDLGRNKAITSSDGKKIMPFADLLHKINRKKRGSDAYLRAKAELKQALNRAAKRLKYNTFGVLVIENVLDMKRGVKWGNRSHHWRVAHLAQRIVGWAEEHGVRVIPVNPAYTSQRCFGCGHVAQENRSGERFSCASCGRKDDADINAARNIGLRGKQRAPCKNNHPYSRIAPGTPLVVEPELTG